MRENAECTAVIALWRPIPTLLSPGVQMNLQPAEGNAYIGLGVRAEVSSGHSE